MIIAAGEVHLKAEVRRPVFFQLTVAHSRVELIQQKLFVVRFRYKTIRAGLQRLHDILRIGKHRKQNHGHGTVQFVFLNARAQLEPAHAGHDDVGDYDVGNRRFQ